jgi:hypothetical protein
LSYFILREREKNRDREQRDRENLKDMVLDLWSLEMYSMYIEIQTCSDLILVCVMSYGRQQPPPPLPFSLLIVRFRLLSAQKGPRTGGRRRNNFIIIYY